MAFSAASQESNVTKPWLKKKYRDQTSVSTFKLQCKTLKITEKKINTFLSKTTLLFDALPNSHSNKY